MPSGSLGRGSQEGFCPGRTNKVQVVGTNWDQAWERLETVCPYFQQCLEGKKGNIILSFVIFVAVAEH